MTEYVNVAGVKAEITGHRPVISLTPEFAQTLWNATDRSEGFSSDSTGRLSRYLSGPPAHRGAAPVQPSLPSMCVRDSQITGQGILLADDSSVVTATPEELCAAIMDSGATVPVVWLGEEDHLL
jgi:hypothetical protein